MAVLKPLYERVSGGYRTAKEDDVILSDNAPVNIKDGSITESKLSTDLQNKINSVPDIDPIEDTVNATPEEVALKINELLNALQN